MEAENSLSCSEEPTTGSYCELAEPSPHHDIRFKIILQSTHHSDRIVIFITSGTGLLASWRECARSLFLTTAPFSPYTITLISKGREAEVSKSVKSQKSQLLQPSIILSQKVKITFSRGQY